MGKTLAAQLSPTSAPANPLANASQTVGHLPATMRSIKKLQAQPGLDLVSAVPLPTMAPTDCLVQVTHAGVCGTDRHIFEWDAWASSRVPVGVTTGHEFVGRIVAVGAACHYRQLGERVSAEGHIGCGQCPACRQGDEHICYSVDILGIDRDGCFADYVAVPEHNLWPIPDSIPDKVAAIFDPLGNAMHTVMAAGVSGQNILITGAGIIGLMAVSIARSAGAGAIFVTDLDSRRLEIARRLGAQVALKANTDWVTEVRQATGGHGVDVLLEMSGAPSAITQGLEALRNGGTAALLGLPAQPVTLDLPNQIIFKGTKVLGINGRRMFETWYQVERFLLADRIDLTEILTHVLPMQDYQQAFQMMQTGEAIKVVLEINP